MYLLFDSVEDFDDLRDFRFELGLERGGETGFHGAGAAVVGECRGPVIDAVDEEGAVAFFERGEGGVEGLIGGCWVAVGMGGGGGEFLEGGEFAAGRDCLGEKEVSGFESGVDGFEAVGVGFDGGVDEGGFWGGVGGVLVGEGCWVYGRWLRWVDAGELRWVWECRLSLGRLCLRLLAIIWSLWDLVLWVWKARINTLLS